MVEHRSLANLVAWHLAAFGVKAGDRSSSVAGFGFDATTWEVWPPLCAGAALMLPSTRDPQALLEWWEGQRLDVSFLPTPLAEVAFARGRASAGLRTLLIGGDRLRSIPAGLPFALVNNYGPTETTVVATSGEVGASAKVHIGRPIANTRVYLLDRVGQPVPVGVAGELYIGGTGVARGYQHRPGLTAERFVPDPFSADPGARLYRTGDLARWLADGTIEFLGRTDFQVKIRGFRIELGEIEARLAEHAAVRDAVVLVREDATGDGRLVAYYVGEALEVETLRAHLAERLPSYMVPAAFVWMEAYPLTPNGKVDRKALPAPESDAYAARGYEAPLGPTEDALAEIFAEVLGVERVGRRDHFFELGGHSLLAVQVISRVRQRLELEVGLGDLFTQPVLADFARGLETASRAGLPAIEPVERGVDLPLSFAQQRLWFIERMEGTGSAYHIPTRMRLRGELDRDALVRALDRIVERHEALRTVFPERDGVAAQRIAPAGESRFALAEHDLSGCPGAGRELARLAAEDARAPFDLARGPLIRGMLVRMAEDDHVLLVTMHHIVSDGWSMGVFTRELGALYGAFREGLPDPLPPLAVQYADYAAWQRRWMEGEVLRRQADYWTRALDGAPELLELPADRPRPARQDFTGATVGLVLDEGLSAALKELSRRHGTTLYMTLLAGWAALLSRLSGQGEVVVGTPTANRGREEIEGLIGVFVNMLPVRVELSDAPTVAELLARVRERALGAQHHQDIPFEQVVELVHPARSMAHAPLFQAMFTWQNDPGGGAGLPGLTLVPPGPAEPSDRPGTGPVAQAPSAQAPSAPATANVDLSLVLSERGGRIGGSVTYAAALFERETVERWVGYLRRVLERMAADETRRVDRLEIVEEDERRRMVEEWNRTEAEDPRDASVHALFEAQVERAPHAEAVVFDRERLTYAELNAAANRLARRLRAAGVGPEARVGVMLERSAELVVALLAVLKAGGAYLPLDPALPAARRAALAADAGAAVLVTREPALEGFAGRIVSPAEAEGEDGDDLGLDVPAAALAYVIYTSGSTGTPKGVGVAHAQAAAHCRAAAAAYGLTPADRVLQFAAVGFDVSLEQMLAPLCAGACVVVRGNEVPTPLELARRAAAQGLTVINPPTAYWHQLAADPDALEVLARSVRLVIAGGEAMSPAATREWAAGPAAGVRLLNGYGPTETVVTCTGYLVPATLPAGAVHVPVGRPLGGRTAYVLDGRGEPAPLGVPGELCIGGVLARGYLGRPAATARAFVPDPFSATPGARMYRTGDRARWLPAGELEFLGRRDFQVKIRGFRIEPGEVEARLAEHPGVRESVVLALDDGAGGKRLVAYVVGEAAADVLRAHLAERLPEYMVPSAFVRLDVFPLTPTGKLDRRALPAPDAPAAREYEAPVGTTEEALAEIWAEVLRVDGVGRHDDFFELGGHSLLAVQVISRVRQVLEVEVALGEVFTRPVLRDFARALETAARSELPPIEPAPRDGRVPLSFAQQRLWFLEQLGDVGSTYHIPARLRLRGGVDRAALVRALDAIVARHEALRTTFAQVDGVPEQRIGPADIGFHLVEHDLGGQADAQAELGRLLAEEAGAPFDLERGPLIRGRLVRLAADDHVLLLTMHHIVSDGWSMGVLTRELSALYAAFRRGEPDPLPALPIQYADYAVWQRRWVEGELLREQADYWTRTLAGAPELLELPTDRPRPAEQDHAGARLGMELDEELTAALKALGRRHGTTLFMTLLAGWATLLSRLSGQGDVVVGTPTAGRGRREVEGLIGFFVNTLALRVDLSDAPAVAELLGRVKRRALEAQQNQDIPFEQVVERVDPVRSLSHGPLFQVMFAWQNLPGAGRDPGPAPLPPGTQPGAAALAQLRPGAEPGVTVQFDLSLALSERGGRIAGSVEYATALFETETVERWLAYLRRVLAEMVADERRSVARLELMPPAERAQVVEGWNATELPCPDGGCVHELFERRVDETPEAAAVVFEGGELTYAELNARANRLAHHLRALGVGPDTRVAICAERTPEMVAGLLAVLKAGGAYVPLDPAYPEERLRWLLDDSAPVAVLAHGSLTARFAGVGVPRIELDAGSPVWTDGPETNPGRGAVLPEHLAYVIYTSGSTGRPKGVMVTHRAVGRQAAAVRAGFGLRPDDRSLQFASIAFDASVEEIFGALLTGAALVLRTETWLEGAHAFWGRCAENRVTVVDLPTRFWQTLLDEPSAAIPECVRLLVVGGEAVEPAALGAWFRRDGHRPHLMNSYGPTETTVNATLLEVRDDPATWRSIGRPVANTRVYLLDAWGEPVPVGVAGELYIGGGQVARGYLDRPGLTAERFVPDPFARDPGARLYRTGDRGRWLAEGSIEFLGRTDFQVKIRGFRIELGEIEARLAEHPEVSEAVVLVREDTPGEKRLVAYIVGSGSVEVDALRAHLSERLPPYMVPAAFVRLDAFPVTAGGKVDRRALPAPEGDALATRGYEAPVGETEQALAEIWAEVLRAERVGRRDSFFELGGHSLLAVQVISRVRQRLAVEVALGDLFTRPVLADFARGLETASRAGLPAIEPVERGADLPLSFAQQRLWFIDQLEGAGAAYHIPVRQRLRGALDRDALRRALDRIVARHEALRTVFAEVDGAPVQRIASVEESPFHLREHDLRGAAEAAAELRRLVADEAGAPFDLARGPLIRGRLVRIGDDDHVLLITMHHIVSDGWSMGVFTRELNALYAAFRAGEPDPLPALPIQYADYVAWQRRWVEGELLREQAEYWQETLAGAPELLELPTDHARPARQDFSGGVVGIELEPELAAGLKALGQRHGATLFMTLLAGWAATLSRLSGQDDVVIGTPTANRGRSEIEGLIGFFVNTLALRVELSGSPSVSDMLARVKARALGVQANQDIPFEQVVELVQPARSLSHTPLFQVMFIWQNAPEHELELSGLAPAGSAPRQAPAAQASAAAQTTAKFDLSLALGERDGRIVGAVEYASALFERATVERFTGYFRRALEAMAADASQSVDRLPLLPEDERRRVVEEWNATGRAYPTDGLRVHDLFRAQAARTPRAVALSWRGERWTYAELERRANQVASTLRRRGVGPEVRVGICLPRTPDLVAALLGVLGAGGAYVPLDPAYPRERLGYMVEDARVALVITDSTLADRLPDETPALLLLDVEGDVIAGESVDAPESGVIPENLSHVIFTSGSTGRPKGVMIRHSSVVILLHWLRETVTDEERSSVLFSTSINFDVSIAEIFGTLAWGGKLVIVENALELATAGEEVVHVSMVPSAAAELLRSGGIPASVKTLNLGGEALPSALAQGLYGLGTVEKVGNLYGPTEDTTYSTYHRVPRGAEQVLIGTPVANTQAYVLDHHLQPVPVGVVGELYLAGDGLSRGYANRPAMTAERFVPCPFGPPGSRMYRVMDRVRRRADGELEYLGRTDFQVKVRGYRIELGEIEARLAEHAGVRAPVVLVREDAPGDRRLVAYYLGDEPVAVDALKAHLSDRLPGYMVPAAYVWMETYPLTPNGKVDRKALPAPEGDAYADREYAAPVGETEEALAGTWAEVLGVERVGRWDNFFELGGHSLLAVRVISRVRQVLGAEVALADLFERPVLADLARRVHEAARAELPAIEPVEREADLPLSFAQQRLWFIERLESAGAAYHITERQRLRGELDRAALRRGLDRIVARHETLRTTFAEVDGAPVQRIAPAEESAFHLVEHDLRGDPGGGAELRRLMADEERAPFDLARGPLIRGRLVRIGDDDHVLLVTMHHIVSDGWSMGVFTRELNALYDAFRDGRPDPLPALPIQYADYAVWQRRWVEGELLREQAEYWKETLAGAPELLELPTDRPRPARQDFSGGLIPIALDEGVTAGLKALGQRHGATLFMTLLAGWAATLSRLSGQDDVVIGTPTANRGRSEIEGLIGFFVNTLAVRVDLTGAPSVSDMLAGVKARALGAQQHQDIPFEQVVELVQPARSLSHTPLFQVMFIWQNAPEHELELSGLVLAGSSPRPAAAALPAAAAQTTAKFDLSLALAERDGRIVGVVDYAAALFEQATVERYVGYLRRVLEAMVADDRQPVERLALMPADERARVVEEWNRTDVEFPADACLHELFQASVERTPGAAAVIFEGAELTFAELNARANRLAHHLRGLGVGPDVRVGICAERSLEMMVGLLAVLKAGGAYVPLDPGYPAERLAYMLADSAPAAVLVQTHLRDRVAQADVPVIELDAAAPEWAGRPATNPERGALTPEHLAYVIYTSGSTGRPKGVGVHHRGVVNRLSWMEAVHGLGPHETVLQKTPYSFDVSVWELFWPLAAGARLVLARPEGHRDPAYLLDILQRERVTIVHFVPSLLAAFLAHADVERSAVPELKRVMSSGEALPPELVARFGERLPGVELHNLYGPTEAAVDVTIWRFPADGPAARVSIGRPVPNTRIYLLDQRGEPVPVGVAGELHIGGVQVARGYLGRAEMTAERFVADPFGGEPGARLYRTGDRARWLPDGTIEYLGRIDFQVKVRGFRIELGEIESRLREHADVREAVVLAREDAPGERRLVAYVVGPDSVEIDAVRAHLGATLPEYMVPSAYVRLEAWPLTPSGKLDRKALPAPEGDAYARRGYEAPEGETEAALAEIFAEVLGAERVGRWDNFFELGGHSLLAVRVISRMRQVLGVEAPLAHLFSHPTVESLAARVSGSEPRGGNDRAIAIRPSGSQPPLFLVYEGAGSIAYAQVLHPHVDAEIPVYALPAPSPSEPPLRTVEGMAARLVRMIREVQPSGPYRVAGWSFGGVLSYEIATQLIGRDEVVEFVGMFDSYHPARARAGSHDVALEHALVLHALRVAQPADASGRADLGEAGAATGDVDLETFVTRCHEKGLLPGHVTVEEARRMRDRLRSHQHAVGEYSPLPLPVAVHLFPARQSADPELSRGWQATLPAAQLRVTPVPGTHLSMMRAPNASTLGEALSRAIGRAREEAAPFSAGDRSPVVTLQGGAAGAAPLFCVPGAGSGVTTFIDLMSALGRPVPVHGLQPRGLDAEAPPHATVQAAAEHYLRALREACPEGPIHLLGHSFGGWVALEMALRLHEAGRPPASLTILDSEVPDDSEAVVRECSGGEAFLKLVEVMELATERSLGIGPGDVASRDEAGWLKLLHGKMVGLGLMSARARPEVLTGPFRTFARCVRTRYRPSGVYPGRLRLVLVDDPAKDEAANRAAFAEIERGWRKWAPGLVFSAGAGNHFTALKTPNVAVLAGLLAEDLRAGEG